MNMRRKRDADCSPAVLLTVVSITAVLGMPRAAAANVTYVESTSVSNSSSKKMAVAECAFGRSVLGGTANLRGQSGQVAIQAAFPAFDVGLGKYVFVVKAVEEHVTETPGVWSVTAGAFCTNDTVPTLVHASSDYDSDPIKSVAVPCPPGMKVVGMGGEVFTAPDPPMTLIGPTPNTLVAFQGFEANDDLTAVTARATEEAGALGGSYGGFWQVTAVAACAFPSYFNRLEGVRTAPHSPADLDDSSLLSLDCSSVNNIVIATAATVDDSDMGQWYLDRFSRYNNVKKSRTLSEAFLNAELGGIAVSHATSSICFRP
jgi:hypothetical protein